MPPGRALPARLVPLADETLVVPVRRSPRARRLRLVVRPDASVEVVAPRRASGADVDALLAAHRDWLERTLARARARAVPLLGLAGALWLGGERVPHVERLGARASARLRGDAVQVVGPGSEERAAALGRWYRAEAREAVERAIAEEGDRLGLAPTSLAIRDTRSRWGSCSARGTLSFSWRLVVAPPPVLRYVVVHELCHLRELNHSPRFWRLLDEAAPGWRRDAAWLRRHGEELLRYDPASALADPAAP
ncbi:MAG: SprT family zinc-dependent metalloprotease [Thermoleophilia bacterium]